VHRPSTFHFVLEDPETYSSPMLAARQAAVPGHGEALRGCRPPLTCPILFLRSVMFLPVTDYSTHTSWGWRHSAPGTDACRSGLASTVFVTLVAAQCTPTDDRQATGRHLPCSTSIRPGPVSSVGREPSLPDAIDPFADAPSKSHRRSSERHENPTVRPLHSIPPQRREPAHTHYADEPLRPIAN